MLESEIQTLRYELKSAWEVLGHMKDHPNDNNGRSVPHIIMITPTYTRWTQKADLTRLYQTLLHVNELTWIVVEDSDSKT